MSDLRVNNITNRDGKRGTVVAGIPQVTSTSHFVPPSGRTGQRYVDGGENIVRDGLVLHLDAKYSYPSNTGIGTTTSGAAAPAGSSTDPDVYTWYDMSGNENNGQLVNDVGYNAANGGSLVFDAVNDNVNCGNADSLNFGLGNFTVSVWFKRNSNATTNLRLLSKGATSNDVSEAGFAFYSSDTLVTFTTNLSGPRQFTENTSITVGQWTNLVGILKRDSGMFIYKNGVLSRQTLLQSFTSTGSASGEKSLFIGKASGATQLVWDGNIAIVKIYNRALTAAEVLQNYNALKDRFGL